MDIRKTLVVMAILGVLFGALLVAYQRLGKPESKEESSVTLADAYGFSPETVTHLEMTFADSRPAVALEKQGKEWRLLKPIRARADTERLNDLLSALKTRIRKRVPLNDREYGLDRPQLILTLITKEGLRKEFLFGDKGVSYSLYMRERNDKDTAIVESYTLDDLSKTPEDLRDRRVLRFDPVNVRRVKVRRRSERIVAERSDGSWLIKEPVVLPANPKAVEKTLEGLSTLEVKRFLSEDAAEWASFGRTNPPLQMTLQLADGSVQTLNVFDTPKEEDRILVSVSGEPGAMEVAPEFLENVPQSAFDWRDRRVADFQRTETTHIEIRFGDTSIVLEKRENEGWFLVRPETAKADDSRLEDLLFRLDSLEATRFIEGATRRLAQYGLDRPSLTLVFKGSSARPFERILRFGKRRGDEIPVLSNRSGEVGMVPASAIAGWMEGVAAFRKK